MKNNLFCKEYIAILNGILKEKKGTLSLNIARKENSIIERCVDPNGETAITHFELIKIINNLSVVKFRLETGRTHQIRVHSKAIGIPILGDTLYGETSNLISRQALHAYRIKFIHPINKKDLEIIAPIPDDMKKFLDLNIIE